MVFVEFRMYLEEPLQGDNFVMLKEERKKCGSFSLKSCPQAREMLRRVGCFNIQLR
jgi:hypothetical protein